VPGGTYFFTVATFQRRPIFREANAVALFLAALEKVRVRHPFEIVSWVVLPDHLHMIWTLPEGESDFSTRWNLVKGNFSRFYRAVAPIDPPIIGRPERRERAIWQRRYWEHLIRDDRDLAAHTGYIHFNPVKHGHASAPRDWPHSSFHAFVARGDLEASWGSGDMPGFPHVADEPEADV